MWYLIESIPDICLLPNIYYISYIRAYPAISHCSHLLLKCRVDTNISHWLKVQSRWFKNYIFAKKCYFGKLLDFQILLLLFLHTLSLYHILLWMLDFFNTIRVSNSLDPDQALHFVGPDLDLNCLQRYK